MDRSAFVAGAAASMAGLAVGAPASGAWSFPGTLAIFAQRARDRRPFIERSAHLRLSSASVIKLPILVGVVRAIDAGTLHWTDRLAIAAHEIVGASESFGRVAPGTRASVRVLVHAMIAQSDNTAANALADHLSFARVNAIAQSLGLAQTRLRRHFMDFAARARGIENTTSAADIGALLLGIERGARGIQTRIASTAACRAMIAAMLEQEDRDTIPAGIRRLVPIANKTGVLPDVRNDVAIVDPYGRDPYVVVLLSRFDPPRAIEAYARLRTIARRIDILETSLDRGR
ncbi:MAG TPA: serine hydrolase [Candidatus Tyrphobacter sp.]